MPPRRRAPSPAQSMAVTDSESEPETPRPKKSGLKKRVSEAYRPDGEGEGGSGQQGADTAPRPPLRSVNINDDAAEKRRRRKSAKIAVIDSLGVDGEAETSTSGNATAADAAKTQGSTKQLKALNPLETLPLAVKHSNFEEWMKLATDNKINAANTWGFHLIDYFHDLDLLRNTDDNSINFQRASCTLDGCIKIWTSRVDSVNTDIGKLLSNLETDNMRAGEEDDSDNPDADPNQPRKKKQKTGTAVTLAKDAAALKNKKPDLEFSIDPLFKKTCADFDEGGASGLLMNHLSLGIGSEDCMRVIFDGSDPMGTVDEEETVQEPEELIDLTDIRAKFLPDLNIIKDSAVCNSLEGFSFTKNTFTFDEVALFQTNTGADDDDDDDDDFGGGDTGFDFGGDAGGGGAVEDFFVGEEAIHDGFDAPGMGGDDFGGDVHSHGSGEEQVMAMEAGRIDDGGRPGPFVPFDPRQMPNDRDLILAMTAGDGESNSLDYFDQNIMKNWAGPEHWKLRRVVKKQTTVDGDGTTAKATKAKGKKEVVKIDFLSAPEKSFKELAKELFAPAEKRGAGINLPGLGTTSKKGKKKKEKRTDHRLPDDMHFSSKQLVTLFLKPKFHLKMRGRRVAINPENDEVDEAFWQQAAAEQGAGRHADDDEGDSGAPIPFNTQFFHEDDFGPGFDDDGGFEDMVGAPVGEDEPDLVAASQAQSRRVRPTAVNYAKRAKRVDVRKLKENIWKNLDIKVEHDEKDDSMDVDEDDDDGMKAELTDPSEGKQFGQVISGLEKSYPREKMEEISTSFCFICLLHLANEQGLKLESSTQAEALQVYDGEEDEEEVTPQKKVGDIWDIKIYRDPTATRSA